MLHRRKSPHLLKRLHHFLGVSRKNPLRKRLDNAKLAHGNLQFLAPKEINVFIEVVAVTREKQLTLE
jgi:hypothetical protein